MHKCNKCTLSSLWCDFRVKCDPNMFLTGWCEISVVNFYSSHLHWLHYTSFHSLVWHLSVPTVCVGVCVPPLPRFSVIWRCRGSALRAACRGRSSERLSQWKDGERLCPADADRHRAERAVWSCTRHPECLPQIQGTHTHTHTLDDWLWVCVWFDNDWLLWFRGGG